MSGYDAWKTACPPEGRTLRVVVEMVIYLTIDSDPDLNLSTEAEKALDLIHVNESRDVEWIASEVTEREVIR